MTAVTIEMTEAKEGGCAASSCDRTDLRRWEVHLSVRHRDARAFASVPPIGREFVACDAHALPVAQYLLGEVLISDTLRAASGMRPKAMG